MNPFQYHLSSHSEEQRIASLNLVRESFGKDVDIGYDDYYEWQYLKNPLGNGNVLLAYDGERAIGQIASIPCAYKVRGEYVTASMTMNLSISSLYRGKGIMGELLSRIHKANQSLFYVAIPNSESLKGHLRKGYYPVSLAFMIRPVMLSNYFYDRQVAIGFLKPFDFIWRKKKTNSKLKIQEHQSIFDERFDELFNGIDNQNMITQVRNAKFLNWRYRTNPRRKYTTFIASRDDGKIEGYVIIRMTQIFGKSCGLIVDLLTQNDSHSARGLIATALDFFWINNVAIAMVTCLPNSREYGLFKNEGFIPCPKRFLHHPMALCLKVSADQNKTHALAEPNDWFFMFGDYETF